MGTGKSSVGKIMAKRMKREYVDLDRYIEDRQKRKIREIFEKEGEPYFRGLEKDAIMHWSAKEGLVITTGCGAIVDEENRDALKKNGLLITLVARPETVYQRVKNSKHRPLLAGNEDLLGQIRLLMEQRKRYYQMSDYYFDTDGRSAAQVAAMILRVISKKV